MSTVRSFFLLFIVTFISFLFGCSDGKFKELSSSSPLSITSRSITDYSASIVEVNFKGNFDPGSVNALDVIQFYSNDQCQGSTLGSVIKSDFDVSGIDLNIPTNQSVDIYVSTAASSDCYLLETYTHEPLIPQDPSFNQVSPPSPSRTVFTPGIFGNAYPSSGVVSFYDDASCTNFLSQGPVTDFTSTGIQANLPQNATTSVYAQVTDFAFTQSACIHMLDYTHSNALSDPPVLVALTPESPSNLSTSPRVSGTTAVGTVSVGLYSDSACSNLLVSGEPADFTSPGFEISISPNSSVSIYAKSEDNLGQPSVCALFGDYTHDDLSPVDPVFVQALPISPTNQTTSPSIIGTSSSDTETIRFFDSALCLTSLGFGPKTDFDSTGVSIGITPNDVTTIYAHALDEAGNASSCVLFTSYTHNTFPPGTPIFSTTVPLSPNNSNTSPFVQGDAAPRTTQLNFYDDENCVNSIGNGSSIDYENTGIQVTVDPNAETSIYVTVEDFEGNVSACEFHASYDHSNAAAPNPGFSASFPVSPSRASTTPTILGTADSIISQVGIYDDALCTGSLGSGTRAQFISSGITITVPANSTSDIYARATDIYGNLSSCVLLTEYIHNTIPPFNPTFSATAPVSPNNSSFSPTITGTALHNPASQLMPELVSFYDSPSCVSKLGEGTPVEFDTVGILINVAPNALSTIYARASDAAGNFSSCTYLTDYIHNSFAPGIPQFASVSPGSPSFNPNILISGTYGSSPDFMNRTSIVIYDDSGCSNELVSMDPTLFNTTGVPVTVDLNNVTSLYGLTVNEVGTMSSCTFLTNFQHYDLPPTNLTILSNTDGSITINWFPDSISSPTPRYNVERSISVNGPFSILSADQISNSFRDYLVSDNVEYFYRVYATNSTGRSQNSLPVSETVMAPPSIPAASLNATGSDDVVTLSWSGFPQNMTYRLSRSTQFGGPFERIGTDILSTSYQDGNVNNGQTYYYLIEATNPSGLSMRSNIASALPRAVSDNPIDFKITPLSSSDDCGGARGVRASWTAPSYYSNFNLMRSQFKNTGNIVATPGQTFVNQCGLANSSIYYFSVSSQWGSSSSNRSDVVGIYTSNAPSIQAFPGNGEIIVDWSSPSISSELSIYTIRYDVYKATDPDGDFDLVASDITTTLYNDTVVNGEGAYYYVQAYIIDNDLDKVFIGYPTNPVSGTAAVDPVAPTNLHLSYVESDDRVRLDWSPATHFNGFQVYRATNVGGPYTPISFVNNSFVISASTVEGMNYFKVNTVWGSVESSDSNIVSFREGRVNNLIATPSAADINLSWTAVATAVDYVVYRATDLEGVYSSVGITATDSYTDLTAVSGQGYFYRIKARFADTTEGARSDAVSAMRTDSSTPSGVSLTVVSGNFMRVNWPIVDGALNYEVFRGNNFAGPYSSAGLSFSNSFNLLGLTPNTEYFVKVVASVGGATFESNPVSKYTFAQPQSPSGIEGDSQIDLSWSAAAGATDYDILRSTDGVNFSTLVTAYPTTSYVDLTATNGNIYFYKLQVNYPSGQVTSQASNGFTPGFEPLAPSNLRAENNDTSTEVLLSWARVSGVTRYNIYVSTTSGSYGAPNQSSTQNSNVRVTGLTTDTVYYFVVSAVNGSQEGPVSNETIIIPQLEPSKPIAQFSDASNISITWPVAPLASEYSLYRSDDGVIFKEIASNLLTTSYIDSVPNLNRTYFYKYRGFNASGVELSLSKISDGTNLSIEPQIPSGFNLYAVNSNEVSLEWSFVPNLQNYEILRSTVSGGPYTLISSPLASDLTYIDNTVLVGQDYYYVIRSINQSGVPSAYSTELGVRTDAGPTGLALVNGATTIDASWSVMAGVVSYNLKRSLSSGGPYGLITNTVSTNYSDSNIIADKTYYYVVEGVYADGRVSVLSGEEMILRSGYLFLEVPIELTDIPLASSGSSSITFDKTQTSFNTDHYDGVISYDLEVVASNTDTVSRNMNIIDSNDNLIDSISIPSGTLNFTRFRVSINPSLGAEIYRLELEQTTTDGELNIQTAKLLVRQENATKTRIYFPLLSSEQGSSQQDYGYSVFNTSDEAYQSIIYSYLFQRDTSKFKKIIDYNAWELEVVVSTSGAAEGIFGLRNIDTNELVSTTETRFSDNAIQIARVPFDEGVQGFAQENENDLFRLDVKCEYNCASGSVDLYKAGLWVTLENLSSARVIHRINNFEEAISSDTDLFDERIYLDLSRYTNPQVYFNAVLNDDALSGGSVELVYHNQDSGNTGLILAPGSSIAVDSDTLMLYQTPALILPSLQNYMTRVRASSGDLDFIGSSLVIDSGN